MLHDPKTVNGSDFDQETAEKIAPQFIARLELANCIYEEKCVFCCKRVARLHFPKLLGRETFKVAAISWNRFGLETFHYKYPLNCEQLQISIEVKMLNIPLQTLNPKNKTNYLFAAATLGLKVKECSNLD